MSLLILFAGCGIQAPAEPATPDFTVRVQADAGIIEVQPDIGTIRVRPDAADIET